MNYLTIIRRRRGDYRGITEPEANNCFSIFTQVNLQNNWLFKKNYYFHKQNHIYKRAQVIYHVIKTTT